MAYSNKMIYKVNDHPKLKNLIAYSTQLLLAILAGTIGVPAVIGLPAQIPAAILGAGIGTIVYIIFTKKKSPIVLSSNFAFVAAFPSALAFGYLGIWLGGLLAGLMYVIIALVIKFVGTKWINKLLPPVIIGPVVALIGLGLAGSAMTNIVKANASSINGSYNLVSLLCGLFTFFIIAFCSMQNKRPGLKLIPFIIGIVAGYALASIFTAIGNSCNVDYLKIIDWSGIKSNFSPLTWQSFISVPKVSLVEGIKELVTGQPSNAIIIAHAQKNCANLFIDGFVFNEANIETIKAVLTAANQMPSPSLSWVGVASIAIAFCPIAFVGFAEHIADHKNMSRIIDQDLIKDPGLYRTLLGDGVGSIAGSTLGVCPNTSYGESIACVAMTRNASTITTLLTACMCIVLSFLSPFNTALASIPSCVMGGVCLALYGYIAVSGLRMFKDLDLDDNINLLTICGILIAGIGGLAIKIPYQINNDGSIAKTIEITSIATAMIIGILTYQLGKKVSQRKGVVAELNQEVKQEDIFRAYLKDIEVEKLIKAIMIFGFIHENVDYTVATLSNLLRNEQFLNLQNKKELEELVLLLDFKGYKNHFNKEATISCIKDNIVRIEKNNA